MGNAVGVIATVGEDRGLTPEQRRERARVKRWTSVLAGNLARLERIEFRLLSATGAPRAALEFKAEQARGEIARARAELGQTAN
jgi:hypothetical protein